MTRQAYESGRVNSVRQDGSREFISLLAFICADGTAGPPVLIYKGASGDLQNIWVGDVTDNDEAYFGSSSTGWSSNDFGLEWLEKVFDPHTREKSKKSRCHRLLIVDGHSSHINMTFLDTYDKLRIIVLILPPYSTHRLQPLDVSLFQPLATAYSRNITDIMQKSGGAINLTKRMFWSYFKDAWEKSFTAKNIKSGFSKCGLWPCDPTWVITIIAPQPNMPPDAELIQKSLKTPKSSCYDPHHYDPNYETSITAKSEPHG